MQRKTTSQPKGSSNGVHFSQIPPLLIWQQVFFLCRPYGPPLLGQEAPSFLSNNLMGSTIFQIGFFS
jgi:hypothetical protein